MKSTELIRRSFKKFVDKINEDIEETIPDYPHKIIQVEKQIERFFEEEIAKIEEQTKLIIGTCNNYANRITILIRNNCNKFKEKIKVTKKLFSDMKEEIGIRIKY